MKTPFFSIIIPTYNRASLLKRCLDSVEAQTYTHWEAIVVDNFSEDNTEEVVQSYNDSRIKYVKNHNYGIISVSRNKALDMAIGQWICFLDSDDWWYDKKLEKILPYTGEYDIVYHDHYTEGKRRFFFQRKGSNFYKVKSPALPYVLMRGDPFNPSCSCVSSQLIGSTRFSEDKRFFAVEDYDFFLELMRKDPKCKKVDEFLTHYDATTGVSHTRKELDRERIIYNKYRNNVTRNEFLEMLKLYMARKANCLSREGQHRKALHYYAIAMTSHVRENKISAMKSWLVELLFFIKQVGMINSIGCRLLM